MSIGTRTSPRSQHRTGAIAALPDRIVTASAILGGALVVASSGLHFHLWEVTYRHVPTIGPLFLLQALAGVLLGLAVVGRRGPLLALAGAGFMAASAGGLLLATTSLGLFGFRESLAAPFAGLLLGIEFLGLVALAPAGSQAVARLIARLRPAPGTVHVATVPPPRAALAQRPVALGPPFVSQRRGGSSSWRSVPTLLAPAGE